MDKFFDSNTWVEIYNAVLNHQFFYKKASSNELSFKELMPWERLNSILAEYRLVSPRLRLLKEGVNILEETYTFEERKKRNLSIKKIIPRKLYEQINSGSTLVLDFVDELHLPIKNLVSSIERIFEGAIQAKLTSIYLSTKEIKGFTTHWDDHDVLIFQIHGKKNWYIFGETRKYPMFKDLHDSHNIPQKAVWNEVLDEGDILYIPRGVWHHAEALDGPCLHLTVGLTRNTAFDFLEWFQDRLRANVLFRMDLPLPRQKEDMISHHEKIKKELIREINETDLEAFYENQRGNLKSRSSFSFPLVLSKEQEREDFDKYNYSLSLRCFPEILIEEREIVFKSDEKEWRLSISTHPFLNLMKDFSPHTYEEIKKSFEEGASDENIRGFIYFLLKEGVLAAEERI